MRPSVAALALLALAACESPPHAPADAAVPDDLVPGPDLAGTGALFCSGVSCLPPTCCGAACQNDGQCCPGTVCGAQARCVPESCSSCGELGCDVDFNACTASCARPPCCLQPCTTDGDCCPATRCQADTLGMKRCMPKACDTCVGLRPICDVGAGCDLSCAPPPSCGKPCLTDGDCGPNNRCRSFLDGEQLCVPEVFDSICNACGLRGCLFHPTECTIECTPAPAPDLGAADASEPGDGAADAMSSDGGRCGHCCTPCAGDGDCCGDQRCLADGKGGRICQPAACMQCSYGCRFFCP